MKNAINGVFQSIEDELNKIEVHLSQMQSRKQDVFDKIDQESHLSKEETETLLKSLSVEVSQMKSEQESYKEACQEVAEKLGNTIGKLENILDK